jgi:hypothetical protein
VISANVYGYGRWKKLSLPKASSTEQINVDYKNRSIYILSNSQAAIKPLDKRQTTYPKLVWDRNQSLMELANDISADVLRELNETANQLTKKLSKYPFTGAELVCNISETAGQWVIKDWLNRKHQEYRQFTPKQKHVKISSKNPLTKEGETIMTKQEADEINEKINDRRLTFKGASIQIGTSEYPHF